MSIGQWWTCLRLPAQIWFFCISGCVQIDYRKSRQPKNHTKLDFRKSDRSHSRREFEMQFKPDFYKGFSGRTLWEVCQSSWAESRRLLAERYGRQDREQPSTGSHAEINDPLHDMTAWLFWRAGWWIPITYSSHWVAAPLTYIDNHVFVFIKATHEGGLWSLH